jgi:Domain of unknown function (DUF4198)
MHRKKHCLVAALALLLCSLSPAARAHDTWFFTRADGGGLALTTGNRFPLGEQGVDTQFFSRAGCEGEGATALALERHTERATHLRVSSPPGAAVRRCFMQLAPFDIEMPADKVAVYFKEIRPPAPVVAAWDALRQRGLPFVERYVKTARIELAAGASPVPEPALGTAMDVLRLAPAGPLAVGSQARFQVLRDGQPLADFNIELVNERSPVGLWLRTDAKGQVTARLPLPGRWLLRGVDLRLSPQDATRWESRFVTYAFDVAR